MLCAGNMAPLKNGTNLIELCFGHFEPPDRLTATDPPPAFILHVGAVSTEDRTAAFALLPTSESHKPQYFTARWGRTEGTPAPSVRTSERAVRRMGEIVSRADCAAKPHVLSEPVARLGRPGRPW